MRVPYPMGFFAKWAEGRIDDPNAGWKGRALWATYSTRTVFHSEGGKENRPKVVQIPASPRSAGEVNAAPLTTLQGRRPRRPLLPSLWSA